MNYVDIDDPVCPKQHAGYAKWMLGQSLLSENFCGRMQELALDDAR